MATVVDTHSIVGTVKQGGLSTNTDEVVQENGSSSLSVGGKPRSTGGCGGNKICFILAHEVFSFHIALA